VRDPGIRTGGPTTPQKTDHLLRITAVFARTCGQQDPEDGCSLMADSRRRSSYTELALGSIAAEIRPRAMLSE